VTSEVSKFIYVFEQEQKKTHDENILTQ